MKVIHIVRQFSPAVGGLETAVYNLARSQKDLLSIDASIITLDSVYGFADRLPHEDSIDGVSIRRLSWRGSSRYPLAPSVLRYLTDADIVHVHAIDFFFDFLAFTRLLHGRVMIASTHGGFFHSGQLQFIKKLWFNTVTRVSIQAYERIVACSFSDAELFKNAGRRLITIENGVDKERFKEASSSSQTRTIIFFGRFAQHKRISALFSLLAQLRTKNPIWQLILAGRNADQSAEQLIALADEAGVKEAVRLVYDPSDAELRSLINEASYFGCLSSYEGFGLAAVEAMSSGLFPILSGIAPFRRLLQNNDNGVIVDVTQPEQGAARILATVLEDSTYEARRIQIMQSVAHYDWNKVAAQYETLYHDALQSKRSS